MRRVGEWGVQNKGFEVKGTQMKDMPWNVKHNATWFVLSIHPCTSFSWFVKVWKLQTSCHYFPFSPPPTYTFQTNPKMDKKKFLNKGEVNLAPFICSFFLFYKHLSLTSLIISMLLHLHYPLPLSLSLSLCSRYLQWHFADWYNKWSFTS